MDRRNFLKNSVLASGMFMIPSFLKGMEFMDPTKLSGYKNLIIVQLSGGNDGLNTIIPYRNDIYYRNRPTIGLENDYFKLNDELGINKNCEGLKELYDEGSLCVINNVGYPNPNRSHFRSTDIWHTGSGASEYLSTGWVGRYLDAHCQSSFQAIEHDQELSLILKGKNLKGVALTDPKQLFQATREPYFKEIVSYLDANLLNEDNQGYLYKTMLETYSSAEYIFEHSKTNDSNTSYPSTNFSKDLKGIATLINSGLDTRVFYTSLGGFDTHANQVNAQNNLLKTYSEGISALVKDLKQSGRFKDTLILTFSEFGRRVKENASKGTDHGAANNVFLIGGSLKKPGLYNGGPNLSELDKNGDIKFNVDFRSIYATVLDNWMSVDDKRILNFDFEKLNFV